MPDRKAADVEVPSRRDYEWPGVPAAAALSPPPLPLTLLTVPCPGRGKRRVRPFFLIA